MNSRSRVLADFGDLIIILHQNLTASCGECDPVLFFRAGFDWQMNTYFTGSTIATSWKVLGVTGTSDVSTAEQSPWWGTDRSKGFTHAFVDEGTTANIRVDMDVLNNGNLVKDYPVHYYNVGAGTLVNFDEFKESSTLIDAANDHASSAVTLNSIS